VTAVPAEVLQTVGAGRRFCLLAHLYPDGDVLGSQLGLGLALREAGRRAGIPVLPEPLTSPGANEVRQWKEGE
jgi:nanoRNase/pAp phosphatase (c-di-AMP/oligoRNAs hydrolase)